MVVQLQWLGLRSYRFHVGAGLGFGKNNLVPTVTVSFDALEAGDTA